MTKSKAKAESRTLVSHAEAAKLIERHGRETSKDRSAAESFLKRAGILNAKGELTAAYK